MLYPNARTLLLAGLTKRCTFLSDKPDMRDKGLESSCAFSGGSGALAQIREVIASSLEELERLRSARSETDQLIVQSRRRAAEARKLIAEADILLERLLSFPGSRTKDDPATLRDFVPTKRRTAITYAY
jgi:hypothetical protein